MIDLQADSFDRKNIPNDAGAGLTMAMVAVPDAIASAILAGVSPTFAFNALMTGVPVGSLLTGTQFMNIGLTSAMMLAVGGVGIVLGLMSARWHGRPLDIGVRITSIIGVSVPAFFLGLLLQMLFFRQLDLLPLAGRVDSDLRFTSPIAEITGVYVVDSLISGNWVAFVDVTWHLILPAIALSTIPLAIIARLTRASSRARSGPGAAARRA